MSETPTSNPNAQSNPAPSDTPDSESERPRPLRTSDLNLPPSAERYEADPDIIVMPLEDIFLLPSILPPRRDFPASQSRPPRPRDSQTQRQRPPGRTVPPPRPPSRPSALDQLQQLDTTSQVALTLLLACMRRQEAAPEAAPK